MDIPEALKLIAGRSAVAQHEAIKALRASGQAQQMRYNRVAEAALQAGITAADAMGAAGVPDVEPEQLTAMARALEARL